MSTIQLRNGRTIGDYQAPYFVAELNTSHFGDLAVAKAMIDEAKAAGCDCVKFQSWQPASLYARPYYNDNKIARKMVEKFAFAESQLLEASQYCKEVGIDFSSTPYSPEEAKFLAERCEVPFIKIASMELDNLPYLTYLGQLGVPLVLSTGMGTLEEVIRAVATIEATGNRNLVILHCTSVYPSPPELIRLNNILGFRSEFPSYPIGYSDHTIGSEVPAASVALGACLIEKHFTLDNRRIGMDNQMATEPLEMKAMIAACRNVFAALGGSGRVLDESELAQRGKMRRSVVTTRALEAHHTLSLDDLDAKRPGLGISPARIGELVGRRLKVALGPEEAILEAHLE